MDGVRDNNERQRAEHQEGRKDFIRRGRRRRGKRNRPKLTLNVDVAYGRRREDLTPHAAPYSARSRLDSCSPSATMANPKRRPGLSHRSGPVAAPSIPLDARSRYTASITSSIQSRPALPPTTGSTAQPISLTKRLLFPHLLPNAPIPPIFQSPNLPSSLNTELYDFLALALRAFINPWWTKITRYDKEFLVQVTSIVTVVFRNIESRSLAADLSPLVFRDLPSILTQHWIDYRTTKQKLNTSYSLAGSSSFHALFHAQQQHIGISADGQLDEVYVRTAIDAVLKACLPPEDWEAEPERYIVREIVVKIVSKDVAGKLTQPWFIHKILLDLLGPPPAKPEGVSLLIPPSAASALAVLFRWLASEHIPFQSTIRAYVYLCIRELHIYVYAP